MSRLQPRLRLVALSAATLLTLYPHLTRASTTDNYLGVDQGLWSNPAYWSVGMPNNSSTQTFGVVINVPAVTVQLDVPATVDSLTLGSTDTLHVLPGTSLSLAAGSAVNSGVIYLDNATGTQVVPQLLVQMDTDLTGGGTIQLAGSGIDAVNVARLISDNTIYGTGAIGSAAGLLKVVNLGNITATNGVLTLNASSDPTVSDSFVNLGTLAANNGTLVLAGGIYANTGGTITAGSNSVVAVNSNVAITGGTLQAATGGTVVLGNSTQGVVTLTNALLSGQVQIPTNGAAALAGTVTNAGTLTCLAGTLNFGSGPSAGVTLFNTGIIQLGATTGTSAGALTINTSNVTIAGSGTLNLSGNSFSYVEIGGYLTNASTICGNGTLGTAANGGNALLFNNSGTMIASNGILNVLGSSYTIGNTTLYNYNSGTLTANGGTLNISNFNNSSLMNAGGIIAATANSVVSISSCTINGGTVESWVNGTLTIAGSTLNGVNLSGTITATSPLVLAGTLTNMKTVTLVGPLSFSSASSNPAPVVFNNTGVIQLGSGSTTQSPTTTITINGNTTFTGGGTINLNGNPFSYNSSSIPYTLANNNTIIGFGTLGSGSSFAPALDNTGVITASNGTLNLYLNGYAGAVPANVNSGTLSASGGTLIVYGSSGVGLDNTGGIIEAIPNSVVSLTNGGTITGGAVQTLGNGTVTASFVTLNNVSLAGNCQLGGTTLIGTVTVANTLNLSGNVNLGINSSNSIGVTFVNAGVIQWSASVAVNGNTTFTGGGSLVLSGNGFSYSNSNSVPYSLTNNNTIIGYGNFGASGTTAPALNNTGVITASNGQLNLNINSFTGASPANTNSGTLSANGGTLYFYSFGGIGLSNTGGVIEALPNSVVSFNGGTITGGTVQTLGNGTISGYVTLNNVGLAGNIQTSSLTLTGTLTVANSLALGGWTYFGINAGNSTGATLINTGIIQISSMSINGNTAFSGGGTMVLSGGNFSYSSSNSIPYSLTNSDTILGYGTLGGGSGTTVPALNNSGTIVASSKTLQLFLNSFLGASPANANSGTLSANGGNLIINGNSGTKLNNTGGVIEALTASGVSINTSSITGGTICALGGGTLSLSNSPLNGVVAYAQDNSLVTLSGTITGGTLGAWGGGTVSDTGGPLNGVMVVASANSAVTLSSVTATGTSFYAMSAGSLGLGTVTLNGALVEAQANSIVTLTNMTSTGGSFYAMGGGSLNMSAGTMTGALVEAQANSIVSLSTVTLTGGTVHSLAGGTVVLSAGTLTNANLGGILQFSTSSPFNLMGTLTNTDTLTLSGAANLGSSNGTSAPTVNLVNTGIIQVGATSGGAGTTLNIASNLNLSGGGTIILNGNLFNNSSFSPPLFTNTNSILGYGTLGGNSGFTLQVNNAGTITASGGILILPSGIFNGGTTTYSYNSGLLSASGGTLNISGFGSGGLVNSGGMIEAFPNSTVIINGNNITGGTIEALANSVVTINMSANVGTISGAVVHVFNGGSLTLGATLNGGTITCDAGATFTGAGGIISNAIMSGVIQTPGSSLTLAGTVTNAGTLVLEGTYNVAQYASQSPTTVVLQNTGLILVGASNGPIGTLNLNGNNLTISGGGTVVLNGCSSAAFGGFNIPRITNNNVIMGSGLLNWASEVAYTNTGTISATTGVLRFSAISISTNGGSYNFGYMGANGGTLILSSSQIPVMATVNANGIIEAQANSVVSLVNQSIAGGVVDAVNGGSITVSGCILADTHMQGNFQLGGALTLMGDLTNAGTLAFAAGSPGQTLSLGTASGYGIVILSNPGLIQFGSGFAVAANTDLVLTGGGTVTLAGTSITPTAFTVRLTTDNCIAGSGLLAPTYLTNEGTITATSGTLTVQTAGATGACVNPGTLRADGGTLAILGGTVANSGLIEARNNGRVSFQTLVDGGTLNAASGGVLGLDAANVIGPDCIITFNGGSLQYGSLNASDYSAQFSQAPGQAYAVDTNGQTVSFSTPLTSTGGSFTKLGAGTLTFNADNSYDGGTNLNGGVLSLGSANALGGGGATGTITFGGGVLQFSPVNTTDYSARFSQAPGQQYMIDTNGQTITLATGLTSLGGSVTKLGAGSLLLTGAANYSGPTTIAAGTLEFSGGVSHSIGSVSGTGALQVDQGTTLTSDGVNLLNGTWTINGTQIIRSTAGGGAYAMHSLGQDSTPLSGTSVTSNLTFGPGAKLDLQNNALIVEATPANMTSLLTQIAADVSNGYITSSTTAANPAYQLVVAVDNANINATMFGGMPVDSNSIIVTEALKGDANLDGNVDLNDFNIWLSNLGNPNSANSTSTGDLNTDGFVDLNDFNLWLANLGHNVGTSPAPSLAAGASLAVGDGLSAGGAAATPEPASLALMSLGVLGLISRRRSARR